MDNNFDGLTNNPRTVREVTEDLYWHALEILPPRWGTDRKTFAMGECYSGDSFFWFTQIKGRFFGFLGNQSEAESALAEQRRVLYLTACQNCNKYAAEGLTKHGAIYVCPKCKTRLGAAETARRQADLFTNQENLFQW